MILNASSFWSQYNEEYKFIISNPRKFLFDQNSDLKSFSLFRFTYQSKIYEIHFFDCRQSKRLLNFKNVLQLNPIGLGYFHRWTNECQALCRLLLFAYNPLFIFNENDWPKELLTWYKDLESSFLRLIRIFGWLNWHSMTSIWIPIPIHQIDLYDPLPSSIHWSKIVLSVLAKHITLTTKRAYVLTLGGAYATLEQTKIAQFFALQLLDISSTLDDERSVVKAKIYLGYAAMGKGKYSLAYNIFNTQYLAAQQRGDELLEAVAFAALYKLDEVRRGARRRRKRSRQVRYHINASLKGKIASILVSKCRASNWIQIEGEEIKDQKIDILFLTKKPETSSNSKILEARHIIDCTSWSKQNKLTSFCYGLSMLPLSLSNVSNPGCSALGCAYALLPFSGTIQSINDLVVEFPLSAMSHSSKNRDKAIIEGSFQLDIDHFHCDELKRLLSMKEIPYKSIITSRETIMMINIHLSLTNDEYKKNLTQFLTHYYSSIQLTKDQVSVQKLSFKISSFDPQFATLVAESDKILLLVYEPQKQQKHECNELFITIYLDNVYASALNAFTQANRFIKNFK